MAGTSANQIKQFHLHFRARGPVERTIFTDFAGRENFYYSRISGSPLGLGGVCCRSARPHHHGVDLFVLADDEAEAHKAAEAAMRQVWVKGFEYQRVDLPKPISHESSAELPHGVSYMGEEHLRRARG